MIEDLVKRAKNVWDELCKKVVIRVCACSCGKSLGAEEILNAINQTVKNYSLEANIIKVGCLGIPSQEPIISITKPNSKDTLYFKKVTKDIIPSLIKDYILYDKIKEVNLLGTTQEIFTGQVRRLMRRWGYINPIDIYHYVANGGFLGFFNALNTKPVDVIEKVRKSGLRGRGGAGFPTWRKWQTCFETKAEEKYIIANLSEGDPGSFSNKLLAESDPYAILEGMLIAGYAIGAKKGYIYCPMKYSVAIDTFKAALQKMKEKKLLGDDILNSKFSFDIELIESIGKYTWGEETSLIEYIEGKRGLARHKPPFPTTNGLFGKPTVVNNVETLACVSSIFQEGVDWFCEFGTEKTKGTKLFSISGNISYRGVVELPLGVSLKKLVYDIGRGSYNARPIKAVHIGGPGGGFIPENLMDIPIDYEPLIEVGAGLGSGGVLVIDDKICIINMNYHLASFALEKSCGHCIPCRMGIKQIHEILKDIIHGRGNLEDLDLLMSISEALEVGARCGFGQVAANPLKSSLKYFFDEYKRHITNKVCEAEYCNLISKS